MYFWYSIVVDEKMNDEFIENMYRSLAGEYPEILSVIAERTCNLQCRHCIFHPETSTSRVPQLGEAILTIAKQIPQNACLVHEGRIFRPRHLSWLMAAREMRPDVKIGIIDNGSYLRHEINIQTSEFKFDWLDISIDGPKNVHNQQRGNLSSFNQAIQGIVKAKKFLRADGHVNSLLTLTRINHASILETARILPKEVMEWHITTITPARPEIASLVVNQKEFQVAWRQIVKVNAVRPVHFRVYVVEDLLKLAHTVGRNAFQSAVQNSQVAQGAFQFILEGVEVTFYPQSLSPSETFVIDADSVYRAPYSIAFTLAELQCGISRFGEDIQPYTNAAITRESNFKVLYRKAVKNWKQSFGLQALRKEIDIFKKIQALS